MLTINGQTELLNGVEQHGETSHLVRPDAVYRTSVLQPTTNYRPIHDSQLIAREFAGGMLQGLRGQQLQLLGLHGTNLGLWDRIKFWWTGLWTKKQAAAVVKAAITAQAAANNVTKQEAATQLFNTALPDTSITDQYPGSSPHGDNTTSQEASAAEYIVNAGGTQQYQNAPTKSANQSAMQIASEMATAPMRLATAQLPRGHVGTAAYNTAIARFYAANKGRVG